MLNVKPFSPANHSLQFDDAVITIHNLRLRTYIGFNPEELSKPQDVVICARILYTADDACNSDDESTALNYKTITKKIIAHVEQGHFRLLEKLTADLLAIVMAEQAVTQAQVTVDKPHALRFADSVGITLGATRVVK